MHLGDTGLSIAFVMETSPFVMGNFAYISSTRDSIL